MPFVMGFFALIWLRALVFGNVKDLVDITVLYLYFSLFAAWTFYNRLYQYGHNLQPDAAIKVEPFTPPFFGRVRIANFWIESFPGGGSYAMAAARALLDNTELDARSIVEKALHIAADICIYTNHSLVIEEL